MFLILVRHRSGKYKPQIVESGATSSTRQPRVFESRETADQYAKKEAGAHADYEYTVFAPVVGFVAEAPPVKAVCY